MTNYQITIGYKAVITVDVKAESEDEAKAKAIDLFQKERWKMNQKQNVSIQDDSFKADGVLDMDKTWNMLH